MALSHIARKQRAADRRDLGIMHDLAQGGTIKAVAARYDVTTRWINVLLREARDDARTELGRNQDVRIQP